MSSLIFGNNSCLACSLMASKLLAFLSITLVTRLSSLAAMLEIHGLVFMKLIKLLKII